MDCSDQWSYRLVLAFAEGFGSRLVLVPQPLVFAHEHFFDCWCPPIKQGRKDYAIWPFVGKETESSQGFLPWNDQPR